MRYLRTVALALAALFFLTPLLLFPTGALASTAEQQQALERVNYYRSLVGLAPLTLNDSLNQAAMAHANYSILNAGDKSLAGGSPHSEVVGKPGFTGASLSDRAQYFGYSSVGRWRENMHYLANPVSALDDWINSVFHRIAVIDPNLQEMGFGLAAGDGTRVDVLDTASPVYTENPTAIVLYPAPNERDVPVAFDGRERPDPLPGATYPIGYPVTAIFGGGNVQVSEAVLRDSQNSAVDSYVLQPGPSLNMSNSVAIMAKQPLRPGEKYTVSLLGTINGNAFARTWSFTTIAVRGVSVSSTGEIQGRIISRRTKKALRQASVRINNSIVRPPGRRGQFRFTLVHPGVYTIYYDAPGYRSQTQVVEIKAGQVTRLPTAVLNR